METKLFPVLLRLISPLRRLSLTHWIAIATVAGIAWGVWLPDSAKELKVVTQMFLSLIKCILVPLIFSTLVVGVAGHRGDLGSVGRLGVKSIIYFEVVTTLALVIGLVIVNVIQPGNGIHLKPSATPVLESVPEKVTLTSILAHLVPQSFFEAAAKNDVLQVVVFALLFGAALTQVKGPPQDTMIHFCESLAEVMFKFTGMVMHCAPFGIGAAMAYTVGKSGLSTLGNLVLLVATLYLALAVFCLLVLLPLAYWAGVPLARFLSLLREPLVLAYTTASSDAAMPMAMQRLHQLGVPRRIISFVMPLGYSFNLDGSTLYLAVASIFVAQAAHKDLSVGEQIAIMLTLMLTSKGMAGIPRASQVVLTGTLVTFGLPLEGVLLIVGVDAIMDMGRSAVNLLGNCLATVVMARWEGEFPAVEAPRVAGS
jgi:proton glutamate symport protein